MRALITLALLGSICFTRVIATPAAHNHDHDHDYDDDALERDGCLEDENFKTVLDRWINFFVKMDKSIAEKYVADDFVLFSESVNSITPPEFGGMRPVSFFPRAKS
jgi:hypothetical protein